MPPIHTDAMTRARYSQGAGIYRIIPAAVARPANRDELGAAIDWARAQGLSVTPRGAGTAMDGGNVGEGLVIDLTALEVAPPRLDAAARCLAIDAAVPLAAVNAIAAEAGLRFAPDPSSAAWATVGGMIGTNAAGARTFSRGPVARWVANCELLTGDGPIVVRRGAAASDPAHPVSRRLHRDVLPLLERHREAILARAPRTTKQTAGYGLVRYLESGDLLDLVIGSEGTLGVVTRATLRLEPIPLHRASLRIALTDRAAIPAVVAALEPTRPTAVELFDRSFLHLVGEAAGVAECAALLLVDLEDDDATRLTQRLDRATAAVTPLAGEITRARDPDAIASLWALRHAASPILAGLDDGRRSLQVIEDGCVPLAALPTYLDRVEAACRDAAIDAVMFGHAGDGHVHVNLLPDLGRPDWLEAVGEIYREVTDALAVLGGTPAGEHGAGRLRGALLERFLGAEAVAMMAAVKRAFDPAGLFNPGVILGADPEPLRRLKVGAGRAGFPAEIEQMLWRVEAERRWGESRW